VRQTHLRIRIRKQQGVTQTGVIARPLLLPVVIGDAFTIDEDSAWQDYQTLEGERSQRPGGDRYQMLKSFGNETMAMSWSPSWMTHQGQNPERVRKVLRRILHAHTPVHLKAFLPQETRPEFSGLVTLRSMSRTVRHGEPDTRYYDLEWRQYREGGTRRRKHGRVPLPTTHKLRQGETLRGLARRYYGDGSGWRAIGRRNGIGNWGSEDPIHRHRRYHVGDSIKIPDWDPPPRNRRDD